MNHPTNWGPVEVARDDDGLIVIAAPGAVAPERVRGGAVPLAGGHVVVDVTDQSGTPRAVLDDAEWALVWVESVYGTAVADAVRSVEEDGATRTVDAQPGVLADHVVRLAVGFWIHRWWPSAKAGSIPPLDVALLELELGGLAWEAERCFIDLEPIVDLLEPHLEYLVDLLVAARGGVEDVQQDVLTTALVRALRASVDLASVDAPGFDRCVELSEAIDAEEALLARAQRDLDHSSFLTATLQSWRGLQAEAPAPVLARAFDSELAESSLELGSATVDWIQVGPRRVVADEDNVNWWLLPAPRGSELLIQVSTPLGEEFEAPLSGRISLFGLPWTFPLAKDGLGSYQGSITLDHIPDRSEIVPDVYEEGFAGRARTSEEGLRRALQDRIVVRENVRIRRGLTQRFLAGEATSGPWIPYSAEMVAEAVAGAQ